MCTYVFKQMQQLPRVTIRDESFQPCRVAQAHVPSNLPLYRSCQAPNSGVASAHSTTSTAVTAMMESLVGDTS